MGEASVRLRRKPNILSLGSLIRNRSFRVICLCGVAGVLVDLDHLLTLFWQWPSRPFHPAYGAVAFIILCCSVSHLRRLRNKTVLKETV